MDDEDQASTKRSTDLAGWRELLCSRVAGVDVDALTTDARIAGAFTDVSRGRIRVDRVEVWADPYVVRHGATATNADHGRVFVSIQVRGTSVVRQGGREAVLKPGDLAAYDSGRPYQVMFPDGDHVHVALRLPRDLLEPSVTRVDDCTAVTISGASGIGGAVSPLLAGLHRALPTLGEPAADQLVHHALRLLGLALDSNIGAKATLDQRRAGHLLRAQRFIECHGDDEDLNPAAVAAGTNVSLGYLHRIFRETGMTVSQSILEVRLRRCRKDLVDRALSDRGVAEIAYRHGFKDAAHFTRAFVRRYGATPSQWRRGATGTGDTARSCRDRSPTVPRQASDG